MRHAFVFNCPEVNSTDYSLPNIIKLIGMHEKHYSLVWYIKIMNTAIIIIDSETIKAGLKIPKLGFLKKKSKIIYLQLIKAIFFHK